MLKLHVLLWVVSPLEFFLQAVDLIIRERSTIALQFPLEPQSRLVIVSVNSRVSVGIFTLTTGNISVRLRFWLWRDLVKKIANSINSVPFEEEENPHRYKMDDYISNRLKGKLDNFIVERVATT